MPRRQEDLRAALELKDEGNRMELLPAFRELKRMGQNRSTLACIFAATEPDPKELARWQNVGRLPRKAF